MKILVDLPCDLSEGSANPTLIAIDMQAHTKSNFNMKSSNAPKNSLMKDTFLAGGFLLLPKWFSLSSKSTGIKPWSKSTLRDYARPFIPPKSSSK